MGNAFFKQGRTAFANGDVVWKATTNNIKAQLIDINNLTPAKAITAATNTTPITITTATHGLATGDRVSISGVLGNLGANGSWTITVTNATQYTLTGSAGSGAYTSGGFAVPLTSPTLDFFDDVTAAKTGTAAAMTLIDATTTGDGILDANDTVFTAVTGSQSEAIIIFKDTGTPSTSPLLLWLDTAASGLPVTPNGGDITVAWDNGANKIAKL